MSRQETFKLAILMLLLPLAGWLARGGYEAVRHTQRAVALYKQAAELVHEGRDAEAVPLLERSTTEDPQIFEAWEMLAQCEYSKKDRASTIVVYERARLFMPNDPRIDQHIADMCALDGRYDEALAALYHERSLVGDDVTLMKAIDRVQRWKAKPPTQKT